jgi:hypothetical protein
MINKDIFKLLEGLCENRIYPVFAEKPPLPYIVYKKIELPTGFGYDCEYSTPQYPVIIKLFGSEYDPTDKIATDIKNRIKSFTSDNVSTIEITDIKDEYDKDTKQFYFEFGLLFFGV